MRKCDICGCEPHEPNRYCWGGGECLCVDPGSGVFDFECPEHGWAAWQHQKQKVESCEHCGGSGILNVEERHEFPCADGSYEVKVTWEAKASSCHACPEGELWKGLLDD